MDLVYQSSQKITEVKKHRALFVLRGMIDTIYVVGAFSLLSLSRVVSIRIPLKSIEKA